MEILRSKIDATPRLKERIAIWQQQSGKAIKNLRSHRGGEFFDGNFRLWLRSKGINHEPTPLFTPQANAITERMNKTLQDRARSMLLHMQIPPGLWAEAISHASYLRNRYKVTNLPKTPQEMWTGSTPHVDHLRSYGCNVYVNVNVSKKGIDKAKWQRWHGLE